ncbi:MULTISPECIES: aldo/keto reductase [unclassified Arthrobacter]|uniref:aldo/keto reductase n=1 Tax=unclassified Arthrobacter TaxID=235627 RepID=UPI001C8606F3|nr:aldo/keto reductase [Arthrobacter sp. MAHUQ-56]MBX7445952.1 aldo/keto reductase [Arthrobacter sp. MAHUQ-56]
MQPVTSAPTVSIGGELTTGRIGFGTLQLTGPGEWGPPSDPRGAVRLLRRAVDLGVRFIDTADSYGPFVTDQLIREALFPYPEDLIIATKVGQSRQGPGQWTALGRPEYLRQQVELSLRFLGLDTIDLLQLHRIDPKVPLDDQIGVLADLQQEGKIRHIGLCKVTVEQIESARQVAPIATVQNLYNLSDQSSESVLNYAERHGITFIPWYPLATGKLAVHGGPLDTLARTLGHTPSQLALAWLLHRSPVILPIPGTTSQDHLEENVASAQLTLSPSDYTVIKELATAQQHGTM